MGVHSADLSARVLRAPAGRTGIGPGVVDDVGWGCVSQVGDQLSKQGRWHSERHPVELAS